MDCGREKDFGFRRFSRFSNELGVATSVFSLLHIYFALSLSFFPTKYLFIHKYIPNTAQLVVNCTAKRGNILS